MKKPWSRFAILVVLLIGVSTLTAGAQTVVRVFVDGRAIGLNPPAVILGARVIVPLRGTFEAMGATVSYLAPRTILVVRGSRAIELEIGRPVARVNDMQVRLRGTRRRCVFQPDVSHRGNLHNTRGRRSVSGAAAGPRSSAAPC